MRITTREAVRRICELHMIGKVEANRVLIPGLAGPGQKVAELLVRPRCTGSPVPAGRDARQLGGLRRGGDRPHL